MLFTFRLVWYTTGLRLLDKMLSTKTCSKNEEFWWVQHVQGVQLNTVQDKRRERSSFDNASVSGRQYHQTLHCYRYWPVASEKNHHRITLWRSKWALQSKKTSIPQTLLTSILGTKYLHQILRWFCQRLPSQCSTASWSPNSTIVHLDIFINLKDTAGHILLVNSRLTLLKFPFWLLEPLP